MTDLIKNKVSRDIFLLIGRITNEKLINNLINFVKNNANDKLSYKTAVRARFTGFESMINNEYFHEFLISIKPEIFKIYPDNFRITDAWGNILNKNEEVAEHNHKGATAFCGILYLTNGGPGTYFKDLDMTISEEVGKYVLFHPLLDHSVKKLDVDMERISIAWNMNEFKMWDEACEIQWVNK
jgi:hypothetical protein